MSFLTPEQMEQIQELCEMVAESHTRSGRVIIEIRNNMPRTFAEELPVYNEDHVLIGYTTQIHRAALPEEEMRKGRQKNRLKPGRKS